MTRTNTLLIKTPEGVIFSQTLAGPIVRFLAWLVDAIVIYVVIILLTMLISFTAIISPDFAGALQTIVYFAFSVGYGMTCEWFWRGQTIGKRVLRLRVIDAQGLRLQFSQVAIRNLLRVVDLLPLLYVVGGLSALLTRKSQRLGDLAANTVVIRIPRIIEPNLDQLGGDKYNSLRTYPHLCARLRQRVTPVEASTALQAIIRRDQMEPTRRVQLFMELANHFRAKVDFPSDVVDGIADEQFVRNVVDVIYRAESKRTKAAAEPRQPEPEISVTP